MPARKFFDTTTGNPQDRQVSVSADHITALAPFISRDETRFYLKGIFTAPHPNGGVVMAATDGHRLGIIYDINATANAPYINPVPRDILKACAQKPRRKGDILTQTAGQCHFIGNLATVTNKVWPEDNSADNRDPAMFSKHHLAMAHGPAIDATFPDVFRIIPDIPSPFARSKSPRQDVFFSPRYLRAFETAANILTHTNAPVTITTAAPDKAALVFIPGAPEFIGLQMPIRADRPEAMPEWLDELRASQSRKTVRNRAYSRAQKPTTKKAGAKATNKAA